MHINNNRKKGVTNKIFFIMLFIVIFHLIFVFTLQAHANIGGDGIFTYTLANNPYSFEYIDSAYKNFPQNNGWINASILKENYTVMDYDRFNYSSVYFHQRIDNHPLLYYSLVHTVCSLFPGTYSRLFTMIINFIFVLGVDLLVISLIKQLYGKAIYSTVPFSFLFFMPVMQQLYILPRMYMALAFFCFWYLYIHWSLLTRKHWRKSQLLQMICCIFLGSQTHYYFYVYAFSLSVLTFIYFIYKRERYKLFNYMYSGIIGIAFSWILFPWIIWHIFFNQMEKHSTVNPWSLEKLKEYIRFLNEQLFNNRVVIAISILILLFIITMFMGKKNCNSQSRCLFHRIVFGCGFLYSLIIFTLDESIWYYSTPLYLTFILWFSMLLIDLFTKIITCRKSEIFTICSSIICIIMILSISSTINFISQYIDEDFNKNEFSQVAIDYEQADCIYIERGQDNLLQGYFFEFGNYDEFKKISVESFLQDGISEETLSGRSSNNSLLIYAPIECSLDEQSYQLLKSNGDYNIFKIKEK